MIEYVIKGIVCYPETAGKYQDVITTLFNEGDIQSKRIHSVIDSTITDIHGLKLAALSKFPADKDVKYLVEKVESVELTAEQFDSYLRKAIIQQTSLQIANDAARVWQGDESKITDVITLSAKLNTLQDADLVDQSNVFVTTAITEIIAKEELEVGYRWRMPELNQACGNLRKPYLAHVFARTNKGKTAFWVSELSYMLPQIPDGKQAMVFFNEEDGEQVISRLYQAYFNVGYLDIVTNANHFEKRWQQEIGDKLLFMDSASLSTNTIEKALAKYSPGLIVIDNMDKVKGFKADRADLVIHELYKWGREMAKTYAPVITVGQASDAASHRKYIDESMMANSKTGKPSELDIAIGIGYTDESGLEDTRYFSICKNKCKPTKTTVREMRHGKWECVINTDTSRFISYLDK